MCWNDIAPVHMVCGHPGPERRQPVRLCNQNPCKTNGVVTDNYLASCRKREPCDDCIADGSWIKVPGNLNQWKMRTESASTS